MDEVYRSYRIATTPDENGRWSARVTHVRGPVLPVHAHADASEGDAICLKRAREEIDRYLAFLSGGDEPGP